MFDIVSQRRALKDQERQVSAALSARGITDYGMGYYDATYKKGGFTIVISGRYLYALADDGRLTELYQALPADKIAPEAFAALLDSLFAALPDNPFVVMQEAGA